MTKQTRWVAVTVVSVVLCGGALLRGAADAQGTKVTGPNTAFTFVLPDGWQSVAYDAVADRSNAVTMLAMLSLPETALNTDNINFWWDTAGERVESGLASLHRFQTEDEPHAPGLLALMDQGGNLPKGMELSLTRVGGYDALLGGGPVQNGLYGAVVVVPGAEALYVATVLGPQAEVALQWTTFLELVSSLDAPDTADATTRGGTDRPGTHLGQQAIGPDRGVYVWVPPGEFMMGSADDDPEAADDEKPRHCVRITRGFWLAKHTVTNAQYRRFCAAVGREFPRGSDRGDEHPVVYVGWEEAKAYCDYYGLRLPTEAEWEYAARGPQGWKYPWGDKWDPKKLCHWGNQGPAGRLSPKRTTFPVGSFPAGASWVGALDMAGNVWEWCADWYDSGYYAKSPVVDPQGPATGRERVLRGGSWCQPGRYSRSAYRLRYRPTNRLDPASARGEDYGFRCVVSPR